MDAVEQKLEELAVRTSTTEEEPQETPAPEESQDPILADIGTQFAAMRQLMEEK